MGPSELLHEAVVVLEDLRVRYFVTGSMATILYGEPRMTNDVDLVAALDAAGVREFCAAFPGDSYYVSVDAALEAVALRGQFNLIHAASGLKVDVMVPDDTAFNISRFKRRARVEVAPGFTALYASAEDVIIKKLEYYAAGQSEKHLRDIAGVLRISGEHIDRAYVDEWTHTLGLTDIWLAVQARVARRSE